MDSCLNRAGLFPHCSGKTPWQPNVSALRLGGEGVYIAEENERSSQCLADVCWRSAEHLSPALSQRSQTSHSLLTTSVTCVYKKRYIKCCFSSPPVMVPIMSLRSLNRQMISYVILHHHLQSLLNKYSD